MQTKMTVNAKCPHGCLRYQAMQVIIVGGIGGKEVLRCEQCGAQYELPTVTLTPLPHGMPGKPLNAV